MREDASRHYGFYWVRFEGDVIVAEYVPGKNRNCASRFPHWHVPGSSDCFMNCDVCELLEGPLRYVRLNHPQNYAPEKGIDIPVNVDPQMPPKEIQLRDREGNVIYEIVNVAEPAASDVGQKK